MFDVQPAADDRARAADLPRLSARVTRPVADAPRRVAQGGARCRRRPVRAERTARPHLAAPRARLDRAAPFGRGRTTTSTRRGSWPTASASRSACSRPPPRSSSRPGSPAAPSDRLDACRRLLDGPYKAGLEWTRGDLACWLHRLDPTIDLGHVVDHVAEPYRLELDGRDAEAAARWAELSGPYERALCLAATGDADDARVAVDLLDGLGADAVGGKVRLDLRAAGMTTVPARRRTSTLANPAGLTSREVEVLRLLDDGLTNAELAQRLYISAKTVDHHVSAILVQAARRQPPRRGPRRQGARPGELTVGVRAPTFRPRGDGGWRRGGRGGGRRAPRCRRPRRRGSSTAGCAAGCRRGRTCRGRR